VTLDGLLLKLYVMELAEYSLDDVFGKTKEDFELEVDGLSAYAKAELISSRGELVDESFEEGGRWSNYRVRVFRFYYYDDSYGEGDFIYVRVTEEVPATEMQEGGDFMEPEIEQVYPHKIETTVYKTTKPGDDN